MNNETEVRDFLRTRRDRLTPQQVGLVAGGRRRVPGLRREDVATLAGMSIDYYAKMERGDLAGVSPEVLDALAQALRMDAAETTHLHNLATAATPAGRRRRPQPVDKSLRPSMQRLLDAITGAPAWIVNQRADVVATNQLGRALLAPMLDDPSNQGNGARFIFLSTASRIFFPEWESAATNNVTTLRAAAGRNPHDKDLTDLIGELVTRSDAFRQRWAAHDVRLHRTGTKRIHHPAVGDLEFTYEGLQLPDIPGWMLYTYITTAGSPSEERVRLLGSLAATETVSPTSAA